MNNAGKYCLGGLALLAVGFLCWYFSSIIAYILVAVVLSFFGHPIIDLLGKIEIKGKRIPNGLRAGIALVCIWFVCILFFYTVIPLVSQDHEYREQAGRSFGRFGRGVEAFRDYRCQSGYKRVYREES